MITDPSAPDVYNSEPSALKSTPSTLPAWPWNCCRRSPVETSHTMTVSSLLTDATIVPSALKAAAVMAASWPASCARRAPLAVSNNPMRSCVTLIAIVRPSGLRASAPSPSNRRTSASLARSKAIVGPAPPAYKRVPSGENRIQPLGKSYGVRNWISPSFRRLRRLAGSPGRPPARRRCCRADPPMGAVRSQRATIHPASRRRRLRSTRTRRSGHHAGSGHERRTPRRRHRRILLTRGTPSGATTRRRRRHPG